MILKFDHVPNPTWDIILFGTLIIPNLIFRFGMSEIGIPVWDIPSRIWDIGRVWATTGVSLFIRRSRIGAADLPEIKSNVFDY